MHFMQAGSRYWAMLCFLGALQLSAQDRPVELGAATVGEHYEHALKTSRPARFVKFSGNAPWLSVTVDGVLTGTPRSDAPAMSEIVVDAYPLDATGGSGPEPLRRTFIVPVRMMACTPSNNNEFSWCDEKEPQPDAPVVASEMRSVVVEAAPEPVTPAAPALQQKSSASAPETLPVKQDRATFGPESSTERTQAYQLHGVTATKNTGIESMSQECSDTRRNGIGCIVQFDRLRKFPNEFGLFNPATHSINWGHASFGYPTRDTIVNAINASRVFLSGSVWIHDGVTECSRRSWSVVTQTRDSSNNLYYNSSDLSVFCIDENSVTKESTVLIVLPVQSIWASVYGIRAKFNDPTWKPVSAPPKGHECWYGKDTQYDSPSQGILPCDDEKNPPKNQSSDGEASTLPKVPEEKSSPFLRHFLYSPFIERLYTLGALPGVSQGSISIDPVALATKSTFDVQVYESWLHGPGWIGIQGVYEHDRKPADDLNSLTAALTYDRRIKNNMPFWAPRKRHCEKNGNCAAPPAIGLRPAEFILRVGPEWSPDNFKPPAPKLSGSTFPNQYLPRNINIVMGSTLRLPFVFSPETGHAPRQPSQLTVTPVLGLEGGFRLKSHEIGLGTVCPAPSTLAPCVQQPGTIFRRVAGVDASARWPYNFTKNFLGDRPINMDFSYRKRWLSYDEPFANWASITNNINQYNEPAEGQSTEARAYTRITLIEPFSAYFQLRVVWQRGTLPPAFQYVHNIVAIGVTFSNPGSSEH